MNQSFIDRLQQLEDKHLIRNIKEITFEDNGYVKYRGKRMLNLSGNDYLGLAADNVLQSNFLASLNNIGLTTSSSRLLTGNTNIHQELEHKIGASYHKKALLYNSGYHCNMGTLAALSTKKDLIISDKLVHASIIDGIKLSDAKHLRFRHNDLNHLEKLLTLNRAQYDQCYIVLESVYSMNGDCTPLLDIIALKEKYNCIIYLDEAHALGVFGKNGLGLAEELDVLEKVDIIVGTFGKAAASFGAYVVASDIIIKLLVNKSRSLIYSTSIPPINIAWTTLIWEQLPYLQSSRKHVRDLATKLRHAITTKTDFNTAGNSPIVPINIGDNALSVKLATSLQDHGFLCFAIRPPTVPPGTARLRCSLSAAMSWEQLKDIPTILNEAKL